MQFKIAIVGLENCTACDGWGLEEKRPINNSEKQGSCFPLFGIDIIMSRAMIVESGDLYHKLVRR